VNLLRGFLKRCFQPWSLFQTALFLNGPPASDKSIIVNCLVKILGNRVVFVTYKQLMNPFERDRLKDAWVLIITEAEELFQDNVVTLVKSLTGGDPITYQVKYVQSSTLSDMSQFVFKGVLIIVSNRPMTAILPPDQALYSRFIQLTFPHSVTRFDTSVDLSEAIVKVTPYFLYWALTAPAEIFRDHVRSGNRGLFSMRNKSMLIDFISNELCFVGPEWFTTQRDIQVALREYCKNFGYSFKDIDLKRLPELANTLYGVKVTPFRSSIEGRRLAAYRGVLLRDKAKGHSCALMREFGYQPLSVDPFVISHFPNWGTINNNVSPFTVFNILCHTYTGEAFHSPMSQESPPPDQFKIPFDWSGGGSTPFGNEPSAALSPMAPVASTDIYDNQVTPEGSDPPQDLDISGNQVTSEGSNPPQDLDIAGNQVTSEGSDPLQDLDISDNQVNP
jgi:hypothetical protein